MKATDAVDPLIKAVEKPLPIKSRANNARIAAMRALVKIGDKRAVPTLMKVLTTSADDQDFLLNQKAALGLAEFRDPHAIPALIRGLFMTGRGTGIFQECRLALVRIGAPAVDPLIAAPAGEERRRSGDGRASSSSTRSRPAWCRTRPPSCSAICGPRRRSRRWSPACTRRPRGDEHRSALIALGYIATPAAVDAILADLKDPKGDPAERASAADALYLSGDRRAVPTLLEIAKSGYVRPAARRPRTCAPAPPSPSPASPARRPTSRSRPSPRRRPRPRACSAWPSTACRSPRSASRISPATARSSTTRSGRGPRRPPSPSASRATPSRGYRSCSPR